MEINNRTLIWKFRVASKSKPGTFHTVDVYNTGEMKCDCIAGSMGKPCRHKDTAKNCVLSLAKNIVNLGRIKETGMQQDKITGDVEK